MTGPNTSLSLHIRCGGRAFGWIAALALSSCGGGSSASQSPPSLPGAFTVSSGALVDGATWQLNRAITIETNRDLSFSSVQSGSVSVQPQQGGPHVLGTYGPGVDPLTGEPDPTTIRFQPACPLGDGDPSGLEPGVSYVLTVRGSDAHSFPLRSTNGEELESTLEVTFVTPTGTDPAVLFHDAVPGPPKLSFRGDPGVPLDDPDTTRFERGVPSPVSVPMRRSTFGIVEIDPGYGSFFPFGLPLNHYIEPGNRIAVVVELDQAISLTASNLQRIGIEFLDGSWQPIPCRAHPVASCGRRGSAVRLELLGSLPPGRPLRLRLDGGFRDLVGQALPGAVFEDLPLEGASEATPLGARVDAIYENFQIGGDEPGSMEDTDSVLDAPRGSWGGGLISGVETPDGVSAVRSKWYAVGRAGHDGLGAPVAPTFYFSGTDEGGVVNAAGGSVLLDAPSLGPFSPAGVQPYGFDLAFADLLDPTGLYSAQPGLLAGDRLRIRPDPLPGTEFTARVFGTTSDASSVFVGLGFGCYAPGIPVDCVPWDLSQLFPDAANTSVEVISRSFEVYTWITRDAHSVDHRVTVTFDAAQAGTDGEADETTAFSLGGGWAPDVSALSGQPWDFLRFEVRFELDVSGDGYSPLERSPVLDFIKVPIDFRR